MGEGLADGICIDNGSIVRRTNGESVRLVPLTSVRLLGRHLLTDVMAAAAVAHLAGASPAAMTAAVEVFLRPRACARAGDPNRDVQFVNDSKATNIEAARRAIETFGEGLVVILGGKFKGAISPIRRRADRAAGDGGVDRRVTAADRRRAGNEGQSAGGRRHAERGPAGVALAAPADGAAGAGVRELRHVPRLRGTRTGVQAGGAEARGGMERHA